MYASKRKDSKNNLTAHQIQQQTLEAILLSEKRRQIFIEIVSNIPEEGDRSLKYVIYGFGSIVGSMLPVLAMSIIQQQVVR